MLARPSSSWVAVAILAGNVAFAHPFDSREDGPDRPARANGALTEVPTYTATRLTGDAPTVDGHLDDPAWDLAPGGAGFRQADPDRFQDPAAHPVFKILHDDEALYFAMACWDDPAAIASLLTRRDRISDSDFVSLYFSPYLDSDTGYNFRVTPHGVQADHYIFDDGDRDPDWNAVWQAETWIHDDGWSVEMRIPFSTMRYRPSDDMTWGLQVYLWLHGRGQDIAWVNWPEDRVGFVSRWGFLDGLEDVPAPRQLEVTPYVVQRVTDPMEGEDDELAHFGNLGADVTFGVTPDLSLTATFQPDFGQVEADPAELNLSPFETFFEEKRPFFIEGADFFEHPDFNLFYSRRIGTRPPWLDEDREADPRIRAAVKLTGKTVGDVSVAALYAATDVAGSGRAHNPFRQGNLPAHYVVGRVGKEFDDAAHAIHLTQTAVVRTSDDDDPFAEDALHFAKRDAYTTGVDFLSSFADGDYEVTGSVVGSVVDPDIDDADPRTGTGGTLSLAKYGGRIRGSLSGRWEHDRLDLNDIGFLSAPDEIVTTGWIQYRHLTNDPESRITQGNVNLNVHRSWLYGDREERDPGGDVIWSYGKGHHQSTGGDINAWWQLRNRWSVSVGVYGAFEGTDRFATRGGPLLTDPASLGGWLEVESDWRKPLSYSFDVDLGRGEHGARSQDVGVSVSWNVTSSFDLELEADYERIIDDQQYVGTFDHTGGGIHDVAYVFGRLESQETALTLRSSWVFTRDQSLELYVQPFLASGDFSRPRELVRPDSRDLAPIGPEDLDGFDADDPFDVDEIDFTEAAVNLNAVYRWEYRPGSTLFLVWTHTREHEEDEGGVHPRLEPGHLFDREPENVFLAKLTYWFNL